MGIFRIKAEQPKSRLRFAEPAPATGVMPAAAPPAAVPTGTGSDAVKLSGRKTDEKPPDSIQLFDQTPKAHSEQYMDRLTTRQSSFSVGPQTLQLEVGTESAGPEILTTAKDPSPQQALQSKLQNLGKSSGEQVIRTGAVLQPHEALQFQVGMASAVDTGKLMQPNKGDDSDAIRPGVYAGVAVRTQAVSTRLAVDTAFGKPRVEVGTALSAGESATVGLSYLQNADETQRSLRLGTEIHANRDTVVGVNVNQPLHQATQLSGQTSVGVYLNAKFD